MIIRIADKWMRPCIWHFKEHELVAHVLFVGVDSSATSECCTVLVFVVVPDCLNPRAETVNLDNWGAM